MQPDRIAGAGRVYMLSRERRQRMHDDGGCIPLGIAVVLYAEKISGRGMRKEIRTIGVWIADARIWCPYVNGISLT